MWYNAHEIFESKRKEYKMIDEKRKKELDARLAKYYGALGMSPSTVENLMADVKKVQDDIIARAQDKNGSKTND